MKPKPAPIRTGASAAKFPIDEYPTRIPEGTVWTSPPSPPPRQLSPQQLSEAALQEEAAKNKERVKTIMDKLAELESRLPGMGQRSALSPTTPSPLEKEMQLLMLQLQQAEALERRLEADIRKWSTETIVQSEKQDAAAQFEEEKRAWLSTSHNSPPNAHYYGKLTGSDSFDERYVLPKPERKQALLDLYTHNMAALQEQIAVLNEHVQQDSALPADEKARRTVPMPQAGDSIDTVAERIVDSDILPRPLTVAQVDMECSLPVFQREARIRGISLDSAGSDVEAMRALLRKHHVITGEVIVEVDQSKGQGSHVFNLSLPTRPYMYCVLAGDAAKTEEYDLESPTNEYERSNPNLGLVKKEDTA